MTVQTKQPQEAESRLHDNEQPEEVKREIPKWALIVGVLAFVVFNVLFMIFAMSIGTGEPG